MNRELELMVGWARELAEVVLRLDAWIRAGNALPYAWERKETTDAVR
jgi:hypothetical protein